MATSQRGTMSYEIENTLRTIFKRCIECDSSVVPSCPTCSNGQVCSLVPADCTTCQHAICVANPSPSPAAAGPNVGAIAGGVIGGVFFVATVVYLVWRFWIKKRKEQEDAEEWVEEEDDIAQQKHRATVGFQSMHHDAASTRTRSSFASSILTRASNIIQIAYIPGVTNREGMGSANSSMLVPPVPPIPAARGTPRSPLSGNNEALFFRPGDLRDSQFSETSSIASAADRGANRNTQFSLTPSLARSSMASGMYRDSAAVEPMPAATVVRAAPRMVSVKSGSQPNSPAGSPASENPPSGTSTPKVVQVMMPGQVERPSTSSSNSPSSHSTASYGKPTAVTLTKGKGRFPIRQTSDASTSASSVTRHLPGVSSPLAGRDEYSSDEEEEHARTRQSLVDTSKEALPQPASSPFFDPSDRPARSPKPSPYSQMSASVGTSIEGTPKRGGRGMGGLSAVIEEATKRASRVPSHDGLGGRRDASPFSDDHETD